MILCNNKWASQAEFCLYVDRQINSMIICMQGHLLNLQVWKTTFYQFLHMTVLHITEKWIRIPINALAYVQQIDYYQDITRFILIWNYSHHNKILKLPCLPYYLAKIWLSIILRQPVLSKMLLSQNERLF